MPRGGKRNNAGRKSKNQEIKLIERLTPLADYAFEALEKGLKEQSPFYVKLWFEYFYGKPKQQIDHTSDGEKINIPIITWVK